MHDFELDLERILLAYVRGAEFPSGDQWARPRASELVASGENVRIELVRGERAELAIRRRSGKLERAPR